MSADHDDAGIWADDDAELDEEDLRWGVVRTSDDGIDERLTADDELASFEDLMADEGSFWSLFRGPDSSDV